MHRFQTNFDSISEHFANSNLSWCRCTMLLFTVFAKVKEIDHHIRGVRICARGGLGPWPLRNRGQGSAFIEKGQCWPYLVDYFNCDTGVCVHGSHLIGFITEISPFSALFFNFQKSNSYSNELRLSSFFVQIVGNCWCVVLESLELRWGLVLEVNTIHHSIIFFSFPSDVRSPQWSSD